MSFSFIQIEEKKTRRIVLIFLTLAVFYFAGFLLLYISICVSFGFNISYIELLRGNISKSGLVPSAKTIIYLMLIAFAVAGIHWLFSTRNMVTRILNAVNAKPLDEEHDIYHKKLRNIVEEVNIATGSRFIIECYVINSHYLNAFSISDFKGRCAVGITEGLLIKLNRNQVESIIAHEVSHIVRGDSLLYAVTSSLFAIYSALFRRISVRGYVFPMLIVTGFLHILGSFLNTWISREKEYRADATAVRLTRNPLSLAEALYIISRGWRGTYLPSEELAAIFIINPKRRKIDEKKGLWPNLLSTHPPIRKRINTLLSMARVDLWILEKAAKGRPAVKEEILISTPTVKKSWFVHREGEWRGPFDLTELTGLAWFKPDIWVQEETTSKIKPAYEFKELNEIFKGRNPVARSGYNCSSCRQPLEKVYYEGVRIWRCRYCNGRLLETDQVPGIIARREVDFSDEVKAMAKSVLSTDILEIKKAYWKNRDKISLINCPGCLQKMIRKEYPGIYPCWIEVDTCLECDFIWFDKNELEVIQYIMERHK